MGYINQKNIFPDHCTVIFLTESKAHWESINFFLYTRRLVLKMSLECITFIHRTLKIKIQRLRSIIFPRVRRNWFLFSFLDWLLFALSFLLAILFFLPDGKKEKDLPQRPLPLLRSKLTATSPFIPVDQMRYGYLKNIIETGTKINTFCLSNKNW